MQQAANRGLLAFKSRCMDIKFDIGNSIYKPVEKIGTGAYGVVCSAVNKKTGEKVAIKKIPNSFDERTTAKRTFRELKILRHFRHENIIAIREILMPKEPLAELKDVYVVFDLMESDLHQIIHSNQPFSLEHIRFFLYQILRGLKYIHSADVIHRDLKPSNLLVNENCELKIGDFGMARGLSTINKDKKGVFMTSYVATRWYRAPELLFCSEDYTLAVDVWSVGCILGEMIGRKQMFPGKNPIDQLTLIVDVLGMPPTHMLKTTNSDTLYNFFQKSFANKKPKDLSKLYPNADPQGLDLLAKMLIFEPSERITVDKALQHPFLATYHSPDDEPECFPKFDFSFENVEMTQEQIRQQVGKMILKYNKPKGWVSKGLLSAVPKNSTTTSSGTQPAPSHGTLQTVNPPSNQGNLQTVGSTNIRGTLQTVGPSRGTNSFQTVGPSSNRSSLPTVGPSSNRNSLPTIGPSSNKNLLQTVGPSNDRPSLQTVGPSSNRTTLQTIGPSSQRNSQGTMSIVHKDNEAKDVPAPSSGSPLIRESLLSGLTESSPLFGDLTDTSPKFVPADNLSPEIPLFKTPCESSSGNIQFEAKPKGDQPLPGVFLGLPDVIALPGSLSDVEMPSAKSSSGDSFTSFLLSAGKLPAQVKTEDQGTASLLVSSDIEMKSAKGEAVLTIDEQVTIKEEKQIKMEKNEATQGSCAVAARDGDSQRDRSNSTGQKTISEDTKALIKAALKNSALKNQMKDKTKSSSGEPGKGGGKMPVTALSRQREREEKRKQKLRRSLKKKKSRKNKEENDEPIVLLTEDDKNMLERWNRMQQKGVEDKVEEKASISRKLDSNVQQGKGAGPACTQQTSSNSSHQCETVQLPIELDPTDSATKKTTKDVQAQKVLQESPKFGATSDVDGPSLFEQISSINQASYPQSPDFLSQLDLPSGNLFSAVSPFALSVTGTSDRVVSLQGEIGVGSSSNSQGLSFEPALPASNRHSMPYMPVFVSTSVRNRSNSDVFVSPQSPKQQFLYRTPADRETPSPPTHIPSPPSCLQQSPPDYSSMNADAHSTPLGGTASILNQPARAGAASQDPTLVRRQHDSTSSDISSIIRQFSRSMVEDPLPSLLSVPLPVTPKGDGGGYGLSLDIEEFMNETLEPNSTGIIDSNRCDSAPLSASLLSDWLDVRNLNSEDMKAIEQDIHNLTSENLRDIQRELGLTSPVGLQSMPALGASRADKNPKL